LSDTQNGMAASDADLGIELHVHRLEIRIETSAAVDMDEAMRERIADAIWGLLPIADDGDVFVELAG
jgi:hypothetical protein